MDIVWNHIRPTSPIWQIQPDYNLNPYIKVHTELNPNETEGSWGMLEWDHFNIHTMNYINQVNQIWIDEYRIDGFRFDATQMIGWDMNQPEYGLIGITENINNLDSTFYQIAEHLPVDPWLINNTDFTSGWNDSFHDKLLNDIHGTYVSTATFMQQVIGLNEYSNTSNEYQFANQTIKYMVSHDEQSLIQEMTVFNNYDLDQALKIDQFYSILLFTSRGIPMLFQGQEFGLRTGWDDVNNNGDYDEEKLQYRPIDWSYLETDDGQSHFDHYSKLARFRKENPAFSKGEFYDLWRYTNERVIVYGYKDESSGNNGDQVVVIANFSDEDQTVTDVPFLSAGQWYNILNEGNNITIEGLNYDEYSIESRSASIFSKNEWNLMLKEVSKSTYSNSIEAYPNPFNGRLNINLNVDANSDGILQLYNIKGELVKSWDNRLIRSGISTIYWNPINNNGDNLTSGIYFISFQSLGVNMKKKVIFLK